MLSWQPQRSKPTHFRSNNRTNDMPQELLAMIAEIAEAMSSQEESSQSWSVSTLGSGYVKETIHISSSQPRTQDHTWLSKADLVGEING